MKKLRLYLDTSVISHMEAPEVPEKEADTRKLWEDIKSGKYDVTLSELTYAEVDRCPDASKHAFMRAALAEIPNIYVEQNKEAERLSALYVEVGGLSPKSKEDALHIAIATISGCDAILSWNFKHIVNLRAITAVDAVNLKEGYRLIRILSPSMMLVEEE
ncbi:MAG: PIN domain-containing protein [Synergistaceae bacterium]|jgi:predicted nucleic acid-binding protein|nr:PIN domain-containing protein [Synergistaceae bacterium]